MIFRLLSVFLIFTASITMSFADEAADKAEFKRLYAEFNELYANSEELDPIIDVAERLYKLAPKAYGDKHMNTAVVTYNLANLYDEKGGNSSSRNEQKAVSYYDEYFDILEAINAPKDRDYIRQYQNFVVSYHNVEKRKSKNRVSDRLLDIAYEIDLTEKELAEIEYFVALQRIVSERINNAITPLTSANERFRKTLGSDSLRYGETEYWLAQSNINDLNYDAAIENFKNTAQIFENAESDPNEYAKNSHLYLYKLFFIKDDRENSRTHLSNFVNLGRKRQQAMCDLGENVEDYLPIERKNPRYPLRAQENGIQGFVALKFTIKKDGTTDDVEVITSSNKIFEKNALNAAKNYKYKPRTLDGVPIDLPGVVVNIEFRLAT